MSSTSNYNNKISEEIDNNLSVVEDQEIKTMKALMMDQDFYKKCLQYDREFENEIQRSQLK